MGDNEGIVQLPVFIINLDHRPDRLADILQKLDCLGIDAARITAIDGATLDREGPLSTGEVACLMSHCKALRAFLDTNKPAAMVLEDDVEMSSDMASLLRGIDWWPERTCLIKLDNPSGKARIMGRSRGTTPTGRDLHQIVLSQAGGGAYLVNRLAAWTVVNACQDPILPIDVVLFDLPRSRAARKMRPLQVLPAMATHDHEGSDIQLGRILAGPLRYRLPRRLRLTPWRLMHKARVFVLRAVGRARRYELPFVS